MWHAPAPQKQPPSLHSTDLSGRRLDHLDHGLIQDQMLLPADPGSGARFRLGGRAGGGVGGWVHHNVIDSAGQHRGPVPRRTEGCGQTAARKHPPASAPVLRLRGARSTSARSARSRSPSPHGKVHAGDVSAQVLSLRPNGRDGTGALLATPCYGKKASVTV